MESRLILYLALLLSGGFNLAAADGNGVNAELPVSPAGQVYRSTNYGFQFDVPDGWTVRESGFYVAHYSFVFLTVNNQRPDLKIQDWPVGENTREFGPKATFQQMQPGEVYVSFVHSGGPWSETMSSDTVGDDLHTLLATNRISASTQPGLWGLNLRFFKRGYWWAISACLRDPITEENRRKVMDLFESFRFVAAPVSNAPWAESLAWRELPEQIQAVQAVRGGEGWPVAELQGGQSVSPIYGPRTVVVNKLGSAFSISFILEDIGRWEYSVSADGKVQSMPPVVHAVGPPASRLPPDLPGETKGAVDVCWVAPYVQASTAFGKTIVTWWNKDGSIRRHNAVSDIQPGFVHLMGPEAAHQGVNEDWQITLPRGPDDLGLSGYITSTADSRVFVHERHPEHGLIALDIYVHGQLTNTVGPFFQYLANDVSLNEDGSAGLLIWKNESKTSPQILTLDTNGAIRIRVDCGTPVRSLIVAPGGLGALLLPNTEGANQNTFMWFTKRGKLRALEVSPNPCWVGWIPGSGRSLFWTSVGNEADRYQLIDWDMGKRLWDIPSPGDGRALAIGLSRNLIIFSVAQAYHPTAGQSSERNLLESGKEWIQTFYAVEVEDGSPVARWQAQLPHRSLDTDRGHFLQLGDKFFYVTTDDFTELNLEDIRSKKHGWR